MKGGTGGALKPGGWNASPSFRYFPLSFISYASSFLCRSDMLLHKKALLEFSSESLNFVFFALVAGELSVDLFLLFTVSLPEGDDRSSGCLN